MIPIQTPRGAFRVWTKRVGDNPELKVLLLHGGPARPTSTSRSSRTPSRAAGIECYFYDQLGSGHSDQPDARELWNLDRFVDEIEQIRRALGLDRSNFVLYGQSWGGILGIEYALHHQEHVRGLVISNMMSSCPAYNDYAHNVLMPVMDQAALAEIKDLEASGGRDNPRYLEQSMYRCRGRASSV